MGEVDYNWEDRITLSEEGIVVVRVPGDVELDLALARSGLDFARALAGPGLRPYLIDIREVHAVRREVRLEFVRPELKQNISARALLVKSPVSRVIASFFLGLNRPPWPMKVFSARHEALGWLEGFIQ